jgi:hypothetical protein
MACYRDSFYYLSLTKQNGDFPYHMGLCFEVKGLMGTLFYYLQMLVEQERSLQEATKGIQEQVEQNMIHGCTDSYLDVDTNPYHHSANHVNTARNGDYTVLTEMDGQQWLPYVQVNICLVLTSAVKYSFYTVDDFFMYKTR